MALVARTHQADLILGGRGTLMARCLASRPARGLGVLRAQGACGKCVVTVLEGGEAPSRPPRSRPGAGHGTEPDWTSGSAANAGCTAAPGELLITTGYW